MSDNLDRSIIFKIIENECKYQDNKRKKGDTYGYSLSEWLILIRRYMSDAESGVLTGSDIKTQAAIRKIGALCVNCLADVFENNEDVK